MEREEKKKQKEEELLVVKLKRGVLVRGKRGGSCCTPSPTWKIGLAQSDGSLLQDLPFPSNSASLSVRKLGANLWEFQPQVNKVVKMSKIGPLPQNHKDKRSMLPSQPTVPPDSPPQQPTSTSSLGRDIAASLRQHHHHLLAKNGGPQSLESPASYCSSMEMAPYKPVETPTSSKDLKGRSGKSSYSLKTSAELLKILNRIWSLEEQHASNMSLVKALRKELDHSQRRVKELQDEKRRDREEINDLMMLIDEYRIGRKSNKHNRTEETVKTLTDELRDERKLRKHSENLHRKLARELAEVKSSFSTAFKELEREREERIMLEELCDEFAYGIKEYEEEVRFLKSKVRKDQILTEEKDGLIIHISEAWLDERMQMKQVQRHHDTAEEKTIVDKLRSEIQTFLKARQFSDYGSNVLNLKGTKESSLCRHSLESFQLNNPASAPRIEKEDDDSFDNVISASESKRGLSGKHDGISCINQHGEFTSNIHVEERTESNPPQTKSETQVSKDPDVTSSRIQPEEKIFEATVVKETPVEANDSCVLKKRVTKQRKFQKRKNNLTKTGSSLLNNLLKDHSLSYEAKTLPNDDKHIEQSFDPTTFTGPASPVQKWTSKVTATDREVIESSSKLPLGVKENTLKAKLLEARLENQQLQPRAIKGLSEVS
ncbi:Sip7p [Datura stramonium]|uniref:Sip7p n=1 Tax=Datura stramonium TaxID=4076 RepID=A0ABS8SPL8_DATST|nr:Sip7p [Datura stramonium]